ncbi:MAG: hypothetical protein QOE36_438 [Gaiellaceae bacterium]|jgi:hypothetical protein|nr:hypothetical protein [Gaiellaceae bacterium]
MNDRPVPDAAYEVECPHCHKPFVGEVLGGGLRHRGFKCPHCKLYVPYDRADAERELAEQAERAQTD